MKSLLTACLLSIAASQAIGQTDPYKTPLYWSTYEYNIIRQHINVCYNYIPETELLANINWVNANLKNLGYNMIEVEGGATRPVSKRTAIAPRTRCSGSTITPGGPPTCDPRGCGWGCT